MSISEFTLRLLLIAIPGILSCYLLDKLVGKPKRDNYEKTINIFIHSLIVYGILGLILGLWNESERYHCRIIEHLFDKNYKPPFIELFWASIVSLFTPYLLSYLHKYKVQNKFGKLIKSTNRYGDEDLWHFFHDAKPETKNHNWIIVRDHKVNLFYYGYVVAFSETEKQRELILHDSTVYNNETAEELYTCKTIYISRNFDELTIEVPLELNNNQGENDGEKTE